MRAAVIKRNLISSVALGFMDSLFKELFSDKPFSLPKTKQKEASLDKIQQEKIYNYDKRIIYNKPKNYFHQHNKYKMNPLKYWLKNLTRVANEI